MPVSDAEKNAERMRSATRMQSRRPSGASFKAEFDPIDNDPSHLVEKVYPEQVPRSNPGYSSAALQNQLEYEF